MLLPVVACFVSDLLIPFADVWTTVNGFFLLVFFVFSFPVLVVVVSFLFRLLFIFQALVLLSNMQFLDS